MNSINSLLKDDAPQFWQAFKQTPLNLGLRINPEKTALNLLTQVISADLTALPWEPFGYQIQRGEELGKHPFHAAGVYYLQETSAMVPVSVLDPQPGERVLDLCAAPGGKTTQISDRMRAKGWIVANDPNPHRVQSLGRNVERWGARNISILAETPQRLADHFGEYFDRVLVDAPCSGEGTFRIHSGEIKKWSPQFSQRTAVIQDEILWYAGKLVRPGGVLVYSTCTFNQLENEGTIQRFLEKNTDYQLEPIPPRKGFYPGIPTGDADPLNLSRSVRIWPHRATGEGHFAARLKKTGGQSVSYLAQGRSGSQLNPAQLTAYETFVGNNLNISSTITELSPGSEGLALYGNRLYWINPESPILEGLKVHHWGWWLGTFQSDRFIPSPALATSINREDVQKVLEFSVGEPDLAAYQRGSPIKIPEGIDLPGSWILVTVSGSPLGWGLTQKGRLKSYFPNWLRIN